MSTLRINNIEAQAVPASPSIDEKIKLTNSSGDVLVHVDGKTSGITTIGINTTAGNIKFDQNSNVVVTGIITATQFSGQITPTSLEIGSNIKLGNAGVITATSFVGSGANLTSLPAQATIANNADNRVITGGSGVNLNGEANLTFDGSNLGINGDLVGSNNTTLYSTNGGSGVRAGLSLSGSDQSIKFYTVNGGSERLRINSDGKIGINATSPSVYARVHIEDANGVLIAGDSQARILLRDNGGGTNEKMMDIQCDAGNINFRTIADNYTTVTPRAAFRSDGNFVIGNRVGTSSPSTNQPVAFHSARVSPDGNPRRVSTGQRCNLFVGSNSGWAANDGGTLGLGGSETGGAGVEGMWSYLKGARQSGNGWEYAGYFELGTSPWSGSNMAKRVKIYADGQIEIYPTDNTFFSTQIGGAQRLIMEHTGGGNIRMRNTSSGTVTYQTSSDYRLKENVVNITNALTTVKALKPYEYKWKHDGKLGQGFFAHEAQETLPDIGIVSGTKDGVHTEDPVKDEHHTKGDPIYQSIDYSKLVPLLTAALQEETAKRESLEARVAALEGS